MTLNQNQGNLWLFIVDALEKQRVRAKDFLQAFHEQGREISYEFRGLHEMVGK